MRYTVNEYSVRLTHTQYAPARGKMREAAGGSCAPPQQAWYGTMFLRGVDCVDTGCPLKALNTLTVRSAEPEKTRPVYLD